jgi:hypothetical protein
VCGLMSSIWLRIELELKMLIARYPKYGLIFVDSLDLPSIPPRCHNAGPSQTSLRNLPNQACLCGNAISFCLENPANCRC